VKVADVLWLEPVGGIAGDMFMAAALDLGVPRPDLEAALGALGLPGWRLEVSRAEAGGVAGTHVDVVPTAPQPATRRLAEIRALLAASALPPRAKETALALFERIARAEAVVHGIALEEVHFHEVGGLDSIVDVSGAAVVLDLLGWPRVVATPPELGTGFVKTQHGLLPVPPPAVLELLRGLPVRPGGVVGEMVTPTGAALLAGLAELGTPPPFTPRRVGYGVGTKRWPDRPNVLRMTIGEVAATGAGAGAAGGWRAGVVQLAANLDDCPGQLVARAVEAALEAGALDAWATPCTMKKGRPGLVLEALAPAGRADAVAAVLLAETTTLGVRSWPVERLELERELVPVETAYGSVRVKVGRRPGAGAGAPGAVLGAHPEYEDCAARARERGVPVKEVMAAALSAWRTRLG
jgi:uncharacterized protein (TIGR00299 family) protein